MKILVACYSKSGNTERVAEAIAGVLGAEEVDVRSVRDVGSVDGYDLVFCGFPVHAHSVPVPAFNFLKGLPAGIRLALFSTHGSLPGSDMAREAIASAIGAAKQAEMLGSFTCRGRVEEAMLEDLRQSPEHRAWAEEAGSAHDHPDEADLEDARTFARGTLKKIINFKDFAKR